jgi:HicB-like protein involved in pilus formation
VELDRHFDAFRDDLAAVAAVGNEHVTRAAGLLTAALEPAFRRRLVDALAEAAAELGGEVRLDADELRIVLTGEEGAPETPAGGDARITLRLPAELKQRIENAAARRHVSVNTWIVQALGRATLRTQQSGRRLSGYGRT